MPGRGPGKSIISRPPTGPIHHVEGSVMTGLIAARSGSEPPRADGSRGTLRWVCTSNPFYALSAMLVCLGLWVSFGSQASATHSWALLIGMAGYTVLLAVTASLLVRHVGVWDDARTVMLLVVLMILATSVTFDVVLARDPETGIACYFLGFVAAMFISEGMLRGVRLSLPPLFRIPYYLSLALFFLYPTAIAPLVARPKGEALTWAMFGFSPAAGLVALTLLPAVRRGRDYVRDNGSPWRWAWYPWSLFVFLGFAVAARSALLCWSMHHLGGAAPEPYIFGFYFLAPLGLAVAILLVELGSVERAAGATLAALATPAVLLVLATVGHRPEVVYQGFLGQFAARLGGTPLYLTLLATAAFYGYAALRRVPAAFDALSASLAALAFVAPGTLDLGGLVPPRATPMLTIAALQLTLGLRRHAAYRCLVGAACLVASAMIALPGTGVMPASGRGPIAYHLLLLALLAVGATFDDAFGRLARVIGAAMVLLGCLVVMTGRSGLGAAVPTWAIGAYPLLVCVLIGGYGHLLSHGISRSCAALILASWFVMIAWMGYGALRLVVTGLDYIALGLVLLAVAVLTSMAKGGIPERLAAKASKLPVSDG